MVNINNPTLSRMHATRVGHPLRTNAGLKACYTKHSQRVDGEAVELSIVRADVDASA